MGILLNEVNNINNDFKDILLNISKKDYFIDLDNNLTNEYNNKIIYPNKTDIFNAFKLCSYKDCKVVIIGQDPYHEENEAMGLAFSVRNGVKCPPSLRNIFKELKSDLNIERTNTDLTDIAIQGVLFLNQILTVEEHKPLSHNKIGWDKFIIDIINELNKKEFIIYILWGNNARSLKKYINLNNSYIIESNHPSPLSASRGFFGSKPFSKVNNKLNELNLSEIKWK